MAAASGIEDIGQLNTADAAQLLERLADHKPNEVRRYIESHPARLMQYMGWNVEPFHLEALNDALTLDQLLWLAPRGSGKSTALAVFLPAWLAIARPENWDPSIPANLFPAAPRRITPENIRIAFTSNSVDKAVALVWQVKEILLHPKIAKLYGPLDGRRWKDNISDTALKTSNHREGTFTALGLGSKVAGGHYDVVVADDWVTEDNARTELQRRRLSDFFKFTVSPTVEPWGRMVVAGTRYHPNDWYEELYELKQKGLWGKILRTPALTEVDGAELSYWPGVYPIKKLEEIRESVGAIAFSSQYQNEVGLMLGEFFESEWMESFAEWAKLSKADRAKARTIIGLDPAIKAGPRNDYTAFVVVSYIPPNFYVRRVVRGQWTQREIVQRCHSLLQKYRPQLFACEVVQGQEWLVEEMRRARLPVRAMRPQQFKGKDKVGRASNVRRLFENGQVFFDPPTPSNEVARLLHEMMAFPGASTVPGMDDCVDSLVWALLAFARPQARMRRLRDRRWI